MKDQKKQEHKLSASDVQKESSAGDTVKNQGIQTDSSALAEKFDREAPEELRGDKPCDVPAGKPG